MTRQARIAAAVCGLAASLALLGGSVWAAAEYAAGRDPFAGVAPVLATTVEAQADANASDASDAPNTSGANAPAQTPAEEGDVAGGMSSQVATGAASAAEGAGDDGDHAGGVGGTADAGETGASGAADASSSASAKAQGHGSRGQGPTATGGAAAAEGATSAAPSTQESAPASSAPASSAPAGESQSISVTVSVDASAAGGATYTRTVSLSPGATAYDALVATGAGVNARATGFGMYVAAIDGVAEKEHGAMSGWVYAVNGVEPNTAASNYVLSSGDTCVWTYVNVEY